MLILGITGGTGCGKTTALQCIAQRQGCVIDCDAVYHSLLQSSQEMLQAIDARFPGVVEDGVLQRKRLGEVVFRSPEALQELSALTAPYVEKAVQAQLTQAQADGCTLAAIDAIGLCECGLKDLCHTTIAILAPVEARVTRLMAREGITQEYARLRIQAQKSDAEFTAMCEHTLMNDCATAQEFALRCRQLIDRILNGGTI